MNGIKYPMIHEWHACCNAANPNMRHRDNDFMYEAVTMANEVPRMAALFMLERKKALPQTHQQCSFQQKEPIQDNHLTCCLGVKCAECPALLALEKMDRVTPDQIDEAKAWTCAAHIVSKGGDSMREGYLLHVGDRMYWDRVYESMAQDEGV